MCDEAGHSYKCRAIMPTIEEHEHTHVWQIGVRLVINSQFACGIVYNASIAYRARSPRIPGCRMFSSYSGTLPPSSIVPAVWSHVQRFISSFQTHDLVILFARHSYFLGCVSESCSD